MMKLGEQRINPTLIKRYFPEYRDKGGYLIVFLFSDGEEIVIPFDEKEKRDSMLTLVDRFLVSFDNGTTIADDLPSALQSMILSGGGPIEGGGFPMQ